MNKYQYETKKSFYGINDWTSFISFIDLNCEGEMKIRRWKIRSQVEFKNPFNYHLKKYPFSGLLLGNIIILHLWRGSKFECSRIINEEKLIKSITEYFQENFKNKKQKN
jgi:hypothetical protein